MRWEKESSERSSRISVIRKLHGLHSGGEDNRRGNEGWYRRDRCCGDKGHSEGAEREGSCPVIHSGQGLIDKVTFDQRPNGSEGAMQQGQGSL